MLETETKPQMLENLEYLEQHLPQLLKTAGAVEVLPQRRAGELLLKLDLRVPVRFSSMRLEAGQHYVAVASGRSRLSMFPLISLNSSLIAGDCAIYLVVNADEHPLPRDLDSRIRQLAQAMRNGWCVD